MELAAPDLFGSGKNRVYLDFYGLEETPFSITPDPEFLYFSNTHQGVIEKMLYSLNNRMGFVLLTGEVGTGKTTICRSILDRLDGKAEMVYIINPAISGEELISNILDDLGVMYVSGSSKRSLIDYLNRFALSTRKTKPVVIIIDDAQTMPIATLEDLRLLSNLETDKEKLLQIILVGQPELMDIMSRRELRQLQQRIIINCRLGFLSPSEVSGYIDRRLFIAGDKGQVRFTPKAEQMITKASKGIPRLINKICDYSMTSGYLYNDFTIGPKHVKRAIVEMGDLDSQFDPGGTKPKIPTGGKTQRWILFSLLSLLIVLITVWTIPNISNKKQIGNLKKGKNVHAINASETAAGILAVSSAPSAGKKEDEIKDAEIDPISLPNQLNLNLSFILQLGSYKTIKTTKAAVSFFNKKGIETHWNPVDLGERGVWYRLFSGPFKNEQCAAKYRNDYLLENSLIVFAPWSVLISTPTSQNEIDRIRLKLADQIDSFTIKKMDDRYRLLTGAFTTKEGAENFVRKIIAIGYNAGAVLR